MTKHLHEDSLKPLGIDDVKIEVDPKTIDHSMVIGGSDIVRKPKGKMKVRMAKTKMTVKKASRLDKATGHLYDLEDSCEPEKTLNIDFGLYQMEDY
ncbi:MAG TPA: hypothetical protein VLU95_01240 [Candidatus Acidoferrum sp.]|nr:hypothetical protein [Candidatus Acidoferrum sp.]